MFFTGFITHSLFLFGVAVLIVILVLLFRKGGEGSRGHTRSHNRLLYQPSRTGTETGVSI